MKVYIGQTKHKGRGVFASEDIKKGEVLMEFAGEVIQVDDLLALPKDIQDHLFPVGIGRYMKAGEPAVLVNHSCEPNAGFKGGTTLVAVRGIRKGEEITFDYSMVGADEWTMECLCGSKKCRRIIGKYKDLHPDLKKKYAPYVPDWVKKSGGW